MHIKKIKRNFYEMLAGSLCIVLLVTLSEMDSFQFEQRLSQWLLHINFKGSKYATKLQQETFQLSLGCWFVTLFLCCGTSSRVFLLLLNWVVLDCFYCVCSRPLAF